MFSNLRLSKPPIVATALLLVSFVLGALSSGLVFVRVEADAFTRLTRYLEKNTSVSVSSNAFTIDTSQGTHFDVSLTANVTGITFSNLLASSLWSQNITMFLKQDATGGRTVSGWPAAVKWPGGTPPTITATANKTDIVSCITHDGGPTIPCIYNQSF